MKDYAIQKTCYLDSTEVLLLIDVRYAVAKNQKRVRIKEPTSWSCVLLSSPQNHNRSR